MPPSKKPRQNSVKQSEQGASAEPSPRPVRRSSRRPTAPGPADKPADDEEDMWNGTNSSKAAAIIYHEQEAVEGEDDYMSRRATSR